MLKVEAEHVAYTFVQVRVLICLRLCNLHLSQLNL